MTQQRKRDRLAIVPGGQQRYVGTVVQILEFVVQQGQQVPINAVGTHLSQIYQVSNHRLNEPVWDLVCLGLLAVENKRVSLTPMGLTVLGSTADVRDRLVLMCALEHFTVVLEVLRYAITCEVPFSCKAAHQALKPAHPQWNDPQLVQRPINWLLSTSALRDVGGGRFEITPRGRAALVEHSIEEVDLKPTITPPRSMREQLSQLTQVLPSHSLDSLHFRRLEEDAATAGNCLGFEAHLKGQPGDTDVLWDAQAGRDSYRVSLEARTCLHGRVPEINMLTINQHREMYQADYAVVLAPDFANGQVIEQAIRSNVVLLPVAVLCDLLHLHAITPLTVADYRCLFENPGLVRRLPTRLCDQAATVERQLRCVVEVFRLAQGNALLGIQHPLDVALIDTLLKREARGMNYSAEDIEIACSLLTNPLIAAAHQEAHDRITVQMTLQSLLWKFEAMRASFERMGRIDEG